MIVEKLTDYLGTHSMVHPTAVISPDARLSQGIKIWHFVHIREGASIGDNCIIGQGVYIDKNVRIGANCKIQNYACIYDGAILENGVFIGPHAILANVRFPRAINPGGNIRTGSDWQPGTVWIKRGASIGAGAVIVPNSAIGEWAMIGAGAVVLGDVPEYGLMVGNPARLKGYVDR